MQIVLSYQSNGKINGNLHPTELDTDKEGKSFTWTSFQKNSQWKVSPRMINISFFLDHILYFFLMVQHENVPTGITST
jgi:hypothetical protein